MANSYPNTRKLEVGQKVIVKAINSKSQKSAAVGHVCTIKEVNDEFGSYFFRYKLSWNREDNKGKEFPGCLHIFLFFPDELTLIPFPRIIPTTGLPNI